VNLAFSGFVDVTGVYTTRAALGGFSLGYASGLGAATTGVVTGGLAFATAGASAMLVGTASRYSHFGKPFLTPSQVADTRAPLDYLVRLQVQGKGLANEHYLPIQRNSPVTAAEVRSGLAQLQGLLSRRDFKATQPGFEGARRWVDVVARQGGIGPAPIPSQSFPRGSPTNSLYRVDIEVLRGPINIIGP
jgi:hypothetical protein